MTDGSVALKLTRCKRGRSLQAFSSPRVSTRGSRRSPDSQRGLERDNQNTTRRVNHANDLCEHEEGRSRLAVCELFSCGIFRRREIMVRTTAPSLRATSCAASLGTSPRRRPQSDQAMLETLFRSVLMSVCASSSAYEILERLGDLSDSYVNEQRASQPEVTALMRTGCGCAREEQAATSSRTVAGYYVLGPRIHASSITRQNRIASWAASR